MGFNKEQILAMEAFGHNTIVSAGAGSGKTTVLSAKVKWLIENKDMHIDDMLIMTFTELAASEMRDRIRKVLKKDHFDEALKVDSSDICTFDAFALSLVKKYHLLLGLDENISIISGPLLETKRKRLIDELFEELYEKDYEDFNEFFNRFAFNDDENIKNLIAKLVEKSSLANSVEEYFSSANIGDVKNKFEEMFLSLEKKIFEIKNNMVDILYSFENEKFKEKVYNKNVSFFEATDYETLRNAIKQFSLQYLGTFKFSEEDIALKKDFDFNKRKLEIYKKLLSKEEYEREYFDVVKYKNYFKKLAKIIYDKEQQFKMENQVFDFSDIANFAFKLINEHFDIRNELKNKYKIIMVDEYQDTSYAQERFLNLIENNNVFMVGDIKQSIYRFRNARPDIFKNKYALYSSENELGTKIDLNKNYRSRKELLGDINIIFKDIMTLDFGDADYKKDHIIESGNMLYDTTSLTPPLTEAIVYEKSKVMSEAEVEANLIAEDIINKIKNKTLITEFVNDKAVLKPATFSSFCIILRKMNSFPIYKKVFEEKGIPLFIQSNEKISSNHLIRITINALLFVSKINREEFDQEFNHLFVSLARSFIFTYSDEKIFDVVKNNTYFKEDVYLSFKNIIENCSSNSIEELMNLIYDELDVFYKLIRIGNYEKNKMYFESFMTYFKEMDSLNFTLDEAVLFLKHIDEYNIELTLPASSTSQDAVKLINVHKSKGLEYPIVYFSDLSREFVKQDYVKKENYSLNYEITFAFESGEDGLDHFLSKLEEKREQLSEEIRLFYVALTRAKEQMIFVYRDGSKEKDVSNCNSFLDLLKASSLNVFENLKEISGVKLIENNMITKDEELHYKELCFALSRQEKARKSSKSISLETSYEALGYGTKIHTLFQAFDFKNDDISTLDKEDKKIIQRFLNSRLYELIKDYPIYKEYSFTFNEVEGIIDLFAIKIDEIILIDYKLKDLSAEEYEMQLNDYAAFLRETFKKPVKAYLYAIYTGEIKNVEIME